MVAHEVLYAFARLESQSVIHRLHFACMIVIYGLHMPMIEVRETPEFTRWLAALKDQRAVLHIVRRISRVAAGNTGDAKSVGGLFGALVRRPLVGPGPPGASTQTGSQAPTRCLEPEFCLATRIRRR